MTEGTAQTPGQLATHHDPDGPGRLGAVAMLILCLHVFHQQLKGQHTVVRRQPIQLGLWKAREGKEDKLSQESDKKSNNGLSPP